MSFFYPAGYKPQAWNPPKKKRKKNPSHYKTKLAQNVCVALSQSDATTPRGIKQVVNRAIKALTKGQKVKKPKLSQAQLRALAKGRAKAGIGKKRRKRK